MRNLRYKPREQHFVELGSEPIPTSILPYQSAKDQSPKNTLEYIRFSLHKAIMPVLDIEVQGTHPNGIQDGGVRKWEKEEHFVLEGQQVRSPRFHPTYTQGPSVHNLPRFSVEDPGPRQGLYDPVT